METDINTYIKIVLSEKKLSIRTAAEYLGYEPQSLRNKFSRNSFNLNDILKICLLNDASLVIRNQAGEDEFVFDLKQFLTQEDFDRYERYKNAQKCRFDEWISEVRKRRRLLIDLEEVQPGTFDKKRKEGETEIKSVNFFEPIIIVGSQSSEAAKWLTDRNNSAETPEREYMNALMAQDFFGVLIDYHSGLVPNCYVTRNK